MNAEEFGPRQLLAARREPAAGSLVDRWLVAARGGRRNMGCPPGADTHAANGEMTITLSVDL